MAKKSKKSLVAMLLVFLAFAAAVAVALLPLGSGLHFTYKGILTGTTEADVKGFDYIFGVKNSNGDYTTEIVPALLVAWILALGAGVCALLGLFGFASKKKLVGKASSVLSGLLLIVAGVLFFFTVKFVGAEGSTFAYNGTTLADAKFSLGLGHLFAGLIGCVGGILGIGAAVAK